MFKRLLLPAGFLAALIIGAGMFALPYIFVRAGVSVGMLYVLVFVGVLSVVHVLYADTIVRTPERHRFVGYANIYLGRRGFLTSIVTTLVGYILISTIYLILSASFFKLVFQVQDLVGVLIFWAVSFLFLFFRIRTLTRGEFLIAFLMVAITLLVFIYGLWKGHPAIEYRSVQWQYLLLPFGPVLFSLSGRAGISTLVEYFSANRYPFSKLVRPIVLGTVFAGIIYTLFVIGALWISPQPTVDTVSGLIGAVPVPFLWIIAILGLAALWSSYTIIAREIEGIFTSDFRVPAKGALLLTAFVPLLLYLLGFQNFLTLVSVVGGVFLAFESVLAVLIWRRVRHVQSEHALVRRIHPALPFVLALIFIGGMLYEIFFFLNG